MAPKVGQYLFASCSAETYGPILRVGKDVNGADVLDIRLPLNDFICYRTTNEANNKWHGNLPIAQIGSDPELSVMADKLEELGFDTTNLRALIDGTVLFKDLLWRPVEKTEDIPEDRINLCTPEGGCYRCTELFWIIDK